jgi:putative ABC transport system permease protein
VRKFHQIIAIILVNLQSIPERLGASLVVVIGMAAVTGVMVSVLSMSTGFMQAMTGTARPDRAIVIGTGTHFESGSNVSRENAVTVMNAPGLKKDADGKAIAAADILTGFEIPQKSNGFDAFIPLRGVGPKTFVLRPEIRLIDGRMFNPGKHELIVGKAAQTQYVGLNLGDKIFLADGDWTVVGTFESGGNFSEGSLFADSETVMAALRKNSFSSVTVQLASPLSYDTFKAALSGDPTLTVNPYRETEYYEQVSKEFNDFLRLVAFTVGGIMGIGALFGAVNTMYSAVNVRMAEIATLRAIGFGGASVALSVLAEVLLLAVVGALIGVGFAWLVFDGAMRSVVGAVFHLRVTLALAGTGVAIACFIAGLGGLFPAIRAARLPVTMALRAT